MYQESTFNRCNKIDLRFFHLVLDYKHIVGDVTGITTHSFKIEKENYRYITLVCEDCDVRALGIKIYRTIPAHEFKSKTLLKVNKKWTAVAVAKYLEDQDPELYNCKGAILENILK